MLPEELEEFKRQVRRFVDRELIPLESHLPIVGEKKRELQERAKSAGLWLPDVPEQYGGQGLNLLAMSVFWHEISHHQCPVTRSHNIRAKCWPDFPRAQR